MGGRERLGHHRVRRNHKILDQAGGAIPPAHTDVGHFAVGDDRFGFDAVKIQCAAFVTALAQDLGDLILQLQLRL